MILDISNELFIRANQKVPVHVYLTNYKHLTNNTIKVLEGSA